MLLLLLLCYCGASNELKTKTMKAWEDGNLKEEVEDFEGTEGLNA